MIWLASFPRSGNTFFRIVLDEVFGVPSSAYNASIDEHRNPEYTKRAVVKTHLRPHEVVPDDRDIPVVCLVRDGRDASVSLAHHAMTKRADDTPFRHNLIEAIVAAEGSYFGGWSTNVGEWLERANLVLRFEDLIVDPIATVGRLSEVMELPPPNPELLPTFEDLKNRDSHHGTGSVKVTLDPERRKKFFRRGKAGAWKDEMPDDLHELFWSLHGDVMRRLEYTDGMVDAPSPERCMRKLGLTQGALRRGLSALKSSLLGRRPVADA